MTSPTVLSPISRMSGVILACTVFVCALPALLFFGGTFERFSGGYAIGAAMLVMYVFVWIWMRPGTFQASSDGLTVQFPARRIEVPREDIASARTLNKKELHAEFGVPVRIGVGGLWGVFGWLWTTRRGMVRIYSSRHDTFVLVERRQGWPMLISPQQPQRFVEALMASVSSTPSGSASS